MMFLGDKIDKLIFIEWFEGNYCYFCSKLQGKRFYFNVNECQISDCDNIAYWNPNYSGNLHTEKIMQIKVWALPLNSNTYQNITLWSCKYLNT